MQAIARKLVRWDIVTEIPGLCALLQQVSNKLAELLPRSGDMFVSMQECREFCPVVLM
jgi:hypothetical protein